MSTTELVATTVESPAVVRINELHTQFVAIGRRNTEQVIAQINIAREIGLLLIGEKERLRGGWKESFAEKGANVCPFRFSYGTAKNYMRVAKLCPDKVTSLPEGVRVLSDIFRMSGALPDPAGRNEGQRRGDPVDMVFQTAGRFLERFERVRGTRPVSEWPEGQKEELRAKLEPLVAVYRELIGEG